MPGTDFFSPLEWVPVVASAIAVGFLAVPLLMRVSRRSLIFAPLCSCWKRAWACGDSCCTPPPICKGRPMHAFDNFIYGAPPMAPLLFPNLMVLGIIALWQLRNREGER